MPAFLQSLGGDLHTRSLEIVLTSHTFVRQKCESHKTSNNQNLLAYIYSTNQHLQNPQNLQNRFPIFQNRYELFILLVILFCICL